MEFVIWMSGLQLYHYNARSGVRLRNFVTNKLVHSLEINYLKVMRSVSCLVENKSVLWEKLMRQIRMKVDANVCLNPPD
jgi:hypothetical protein